MTQPALIAAGRPVLVRDWRGDWLGWTRMVPDVTDEPCHIACTDPLNSGRRRYGVYTVPWRRLADPSLAKELT
jgi:hypothetical protein